MSGFDWDATDDADALVSEAWPDLSPRSSRLVAVGLLRTLEHLIIEPNARGFITALDGFAAGTVTLAELDQWEERVRERRAVAVRAAALVWLAAFPRDRTAPHHIAPIARISRGVAMILASAAAGPVPPDVHPGSAWHDVFQSAWQAARRTNADVIRCAVPNPARAVPFDAAWRTSTAAAIARQFRTAGDAGGMPVLADALQDAGCSDEALLAHLRTQARHRAGCWGVRVVLGE